MRWTAVRDWHLGQRGTPPRAAIGCVFVDRVTMPLVGSDQTAAKPSLCRRRVPMIGRRSQWYADLALRLYGQYCSLSEI
jgi:hypothetical protein